MAHVDTLRNLSRDCFALMAPVLEGDTWRAR